MAGPTRATRRERDVDSFDRRARGDEHDWRSEFHTRVVAGSAEVALWAMPHPATVLDVGCGTGALLRALADRLPARVALSGVDPAPAMIEVGRAGLGAYPRVRLARAGAERLPFGNASFDLVVSTVSFDHWADQPAGLAEVARVLRPGGRLVLVDLFAIGWLRPIAALGRRRAPHAHRRRAGGHARRRAAGAARVAARLRPGPAPAGPGGRRRLQLAGTAGLQPTGRTDGRWRRRHATATG